MQRTTINLLFVGHQVRYNICICLSKIQVQLKSSFVLTKHFHFVTSLIIYDSKNISTFRYIVNNSAQEEEADLKINMLPFFLMANQNKSVNPISLQRYLLYIGVY